MVFEGEEAKDKDKGSGFWAEVKELIGLSGS